MKTAIIFIVAIAIAGFAGFATQNFFANQKQQQAATSNPVVGSIRPEFAIRDIQGDIRNIRDWDDKVILLNFWATWCPPCKQEIPHFIELQQQYGNDGLQIVGIALDNNEDVTAFAMEMEMNYPVMAGEREAIELAKRYGNSIGALPFSVIIDKNATIRNTITGELSKDRALELLRAAGLESR